jgi:hypothetical protein
MAILTEDEILIYAPKLADLIGSDELIGLIQLTQSVIEGADGIGRPIELTIFTETKWWQNGSPIAPSYHLLYNPYDESYESSVKLILSYPEQYKKTALIRNSSNSSNTFSSEGSNLQNYIYNLYDSGSEITLGIGEFSISNGILTIHRNSHTWRHLEVTYQAGLDFTLDTNEIRNFKAGFGKLLSFIATSPQYNDSIKRVKVPFDEYEIEYNQGGDIYDIPPSLLSFAMKYKPIVV